MMRSVLVALLLVPLGDLRADESAVSDMKALEEVRKKIERKIPNTWEVVLNLAGGDFSGEDAPALVVRTKRPVATLTQYPSPAPGQKPAEREGVFEIKFECVPPVTESEYAALAKKNAENTKRRLAFSKERLQGISWGAKSPSPYSPARYSPEGEAQVREVREYAFLWMRTKLRDLPSHHYGRLSFDRHYPYFTRIRNPNKAKQFQKLLKDLDTILKPYRKSE